MYESLTAFIPVLLNGSYGQWVFNKENDGTTEHPIQFLFVNYAEAVRELEDEIYKFEKEHPEYKLNRYGEILEKNGIEWGSESMQKADTSKLDGNAVMALLLGAVRAERFCDGALLGFCKGGSISMWLGRLKQIDEG